MAVILLIWIIHIYEQNGGVQWFDMRKKGQAPFLQYQRCENTEIRLSYRMMNDVV